MRLALLSIFILLVLTTTAPIDTGAQDTSAAPIPAYHKVWKHWAWPWPKVETQYNNGRMYRKERRSHIKKGFVDWIA